MPSSISIDNISNNAILLPSFTVHGDFALSLRPETKGDITSYAGPGAGGGGTIWITAKCKLQNAAGSDITVINAFVNTSATSWQADFVGQSPGINLQLLPVLTSAAGIVTGTPITGIEIRANGGITITPVPEPQPPGPPPIGPDDRKTLKPKGDFHLKSADVDEFRSVIVIDGVKQMDSILTLAHLRVNNVKRTWDTKKGHEYEKPTGKIASHVVRLKMKNGDVLHVSRAKLSLRSKKRKKKKKKGS
jgi:hypothetical protein